MDHRKAFVVSRILLGVSLLSAVALLLLLRYEAVALTLGVLAWAAAIGMIAVLRKYCKCPHCGGKLPATGGCPEKCPHCEGLL